MIWCLCIFKGCCRNVLKEFCLQLVRTKFISISWLNQKLNYFDTNKIPDNKTKNNLTQITSMMIKTKITGRKADHSARLCNLQLHVNVITMWLVFNLVKNNTSTQPKENHFCLHWMQNVEVIQAEIVGHSDLHLCAVFLTVHDKLTCEVSSTWTKQFVYIGPKRKRKMSKSFRQKQQVTVTYICVQCFQLSTTNSHVKFHQPGPSSLSTLDLNANVIIGRRRRTGELKIN